MTTKDKFIGDLKDIHRKLMSIREAGMETYAILVHEFLPLLTSSDALKNEFDRRVHFEEDPQAFVPEDKIYKTFSFKFVSQLLDDEDFRLQHLMDHEEFILAQQRISDVLLESIIIAQSERVKTKVTVNTKKKAGKPSHVKHKDGHIYLDGTRLNNRKNPRVVRIYEKLFGGSVAVGGSIDAGELYNYAYDTYPTSPKEWDKLYSVLHRLNTKAHKLGSGNIVDIDLSAAQKVTRLR